MKGWLTIREAAEMLECSTGTIKKYRREGRLEVFQRVPNGTLLISVASIQKLLPPTR